MCGAAVGCAVGCGVGTGTAHRLQCLTQALGPSPKQVKESPLSQTSPISRTPFPQSGGGSGVGVGLGTTAPIRLVSGAQPSMAQAAVPWPERTLSRCPHGLPSIRSGRAKAVAGRLTIAATAVRNRTNLRSKGIIFAASFRRIRHDFTSRMNHASTWTGSAESKFYLSTRHAERSLWSVPRCPPEPHETPRGMEARALDRP
jgi:hypothetical protein